MQSFVRFKTHHIVTVEQPVQLLSGEGDDIIGNLAWPFKACLLQALLPHTKTAPFPIQDLHFVAAAIAKTQTTARKMDRAVSLLRPG